MERGRPICPIAVLYSSINVLYLTLKIVVYNQQFTFLSFALCLDKKPLFNKVLYIGRLLFIAII